MVNLTQRIETLERIIADRTPVAPMQFIVLNPDRDTPEEYERKRQHIAATEASGVEIIVYEVV
jgi:hypothetical protein